MVRPHSGNPVSGHLPAIQGTSSATSPAAPSPGVSQIPGGSFFASVEGDLKGASGTAAGAVITVVLVLLVVGGAVWLVRS